MVVDAPDAEAAQYAKSTAAMRIADYIVLKQNEVIDVQEDKELRDAIQWYVAKCGAYRTIMNRKTRPSKCDVSIFND